MDVLLTDMKSQRKACPRPDRGTQNKEVDAKKRLLPFSSFLFPLRLCVNTVETRLHTALRLAPAACAFELR